jgi:hypothetical protein
MQQAKKEKNRIPSSHGLVEHIFIMMYANHDVTEKK